MMRSAWWIVVLVVSLTACPPGGGGGTGGGSSAGGGSNVGGGNTGGGGGAGGGGSGLADAGHWDLTPAANPITISATVQPDAGVSLDVPVDGGTLKATGVDGTTFELTVPPNAVFQTTTITMSPVQLASQPFGTGPAWGVQLSPDGLNFNLPLKLVITPPAGQAPPPAQQLAFGWSGANNAASLALVDPKDSRMVLELMHFSSYAYATANAGLDASLEPARARLGGTAEGRLESAIAEVLAAEHWKELGGDPSGALESKEQALALLDQYDAQVVQVRNAAAGTSCAAGRLALETMQKLKHSAELLGIDNVHGYTDTTIALWPTVAKVCLDEEWTLCKTDHIVQRLIPDYLNLQHQADYFAPTDMTWLAKAKDYIYRCHQYRLDVKSKVTNTSPYWQLEEDMQGSVNLKKQSQDDPLSSVVSQDPHGPLISMAYALTYTGGDACEQAKNITQHNAFFYVTDLAFVLEPTGEIDDLTLYNQPGAAGGLSNPTLFGSEYDELNTCALPPSTVHVPDFNWFSIYTVVLTPLPDYFNLTDGYFLKNWTVPNDGGELIGKKVMSLTSNDNGITSTAPTTYELHHTPSGT